MARSALDTSSAYTHNGDRALLTSLGLRTDGFTRQWTDLGTVVVEKAKEETYGHPPKKQLKPAATVKVEVSAMPAQFWRFTITRPQDAIEELGKDAQDRSLWQVIYEPVERFILATGSGSFSHYWPMAKAVAEHMISIKIEAA